MSYDPKILNPWSMTNYKKPKPTTWQIVAAICTELIKAVLFGLAVAVVYTVLT